MGKYSNIEWVDKVLQGLEEGYLAAQDLKRNYYDMKRDNTQHGDDYFHCKANFEATQRGKIGEAVARIVGDAKEGWDYPKNRLLKGLSPYEAYLDYKRDKHINSLGRFQAKRGIFSNSREGCDIFRARGINDKY